MMRSAIKEDEWMLYLHGAVMGLAGGFIHLAHLRREATGDDHEQQTQTTARSLDALPGVARIAATAWLARRRVGAQERRPDRAEAR